jgi:hypothetical protein
MGPPVRDRPSARDRDRVEIKAFAPRFLASFTQGSDRLLHAMYDQVAPVLSERFHELLEASSGQLDVLSRVAELVGLPELSVDRPLDDVDSEALAQRIAWRSTARWAVLALLWTLAEQLPAESWSPSDWANAVLGDKGVRPRSRSGLPARDDERVALTIAAERLADSSTGQCGRALLLRDRPIVMHVGDETGIVASEVRPVALLETVGELSGREAELKKGDRILLAATEDSERGLDLDGVHSHTRGILTMLEDGGIGLGSGTRLAPVAQGLALLFERKPAKDAR